MPLIAPACRLKPVPPACRVQGEIRGLLGSATQFLRPNHLLTIPRPDEDEPDGYECNDALT
jgi:hypothetical protein